MNILIKLTSIVALIIAPHINEGNHGDAHATHVNAAAMHSDHDADANAGNVTDGGNGNGTSADDAANRDGIDRLETRATDYSTKLITGYEVKGATGGMENDLMTFIMRAIPADKTTWIGFNEVKYAGTALTASSDAQVNNTAEILKAFKTLKLEVGATGDNAQAKADALRNAIIAKGIDADRISATGYAADAPFATKSLYLDRPATQGPALRVSDR